MPLPRFPRYDGYGTIAGMRSHRKTIILAAAVIVLALAFIAIGVMRGDALEIYRKAARICFECIGIG